MEEKEGRADGEISQDKEVTPISNTTQQKQTTSFDFKKKGFQLSEYFLLWSHSFTDGAG